MQQKVLIAVLIVALVAPAAMAQRNPIELTPEINYLWTSSLDASMGGTPGTFDIDDSAAYGLTLDYEFRPGSQLELLYLYQKSDLTFDPFNDVKSSTGVVTSYYHIGALQGFRRGNVMPFTGLTLGASSFNPESRGETMWKFSIGLNAGAKVYLSERIGLRFHGRALMSFLDTGAGVWFGTGGVSMGITGWGVWQWDLGGGLIIQL